MADVTVTLFKDNRNVVIETTEEQIQLALKSIGEKAVGYAIGDCPVETGNLKGSLTYKTAEYQGGSSEGEGGSSTPHGTPDKKEVQIGTNVKYAIYQEFGEHYHHDDGKAHFLRDSIAQHQDDYIAILEACLAKV